MKDYRIFTDSCADLSEALVQALDINVLPMTFSLDGVDFHDYPDNREMDPHDFYDKLRGGSMSSTSLINVAEFITAFQPVLEGGEDILYLAFSSNLSSTIKSAVIAADELKEKYKDRKITVVDTLGASMGQGLIVWHAVQHKQAGGSIEEVAKWVEDNKLRFAMWFTVDDLGCLKRGGRLSGAAAMTATLLNIKPILQVDDEGHLVGNGKVRSRRSSLNKLVEHFGKTAILTEAKDSVVFISHGDCLEDCEYVRDQIAQKYGITKFYMNEIGPVIGSHSGPGTVALFYFARHRN